MHARIKNVHREYRHVTDGLSIDVSRFEIDATKKKKKKKKNSGCISFVCLHVVCAAGNYENKFLFSNLGLQFVLRLEFTSKTRKENYDEK